MSGIEWTGITWNPVTGCDRISPGCDHCYALTLARRLKAMGQARYQLDGDPRTSGPGFAVTCHPAALTLPYRWRSPRLVFVNSMSDLFHARVPETFIRDVFAVMAATPAHTYQVLTKRPRRALRLAEVLPWPPNVWLGVSIETGRYLHRADTLRAVPAAVRFISAEPLLGPLDGVDLAGIGWVIAGGESGPDARPMHPGWARSLRDQCAAHGVPYFFKQRGAWTWEFQPGEPEPRVYVCVADGRVAGEQTALADGGSWTAVRRVGKGRAGRVLDGRTWDQMPATTTGGTRR